ncbi:MAG: hypothetical protein F6K28_53070 [Microcoleus sp. SIO2G3]|nr:hypothetical protein [Microcoleus sp. SIO2G3]
MFLSFRRCCQVCLLMVLASSIAACSMQPAPLPAPLPQPSQPATPTAIAWNTILRTNSAPEGWQVSPCENPTLLCVRSNGQIVGTVELFTSAIAGSEFEQLLSEADGSREKALQAWVQNFYDSIERDRATGIPDVRFTSQPPTAVSIGQLPGLRYEFASRRSNNALYERMIGYVASDDDTLYVIVTGMINGDPAGTFSNDTDLQQFEPHFDRIVAGLNLPVTR